MHDYDRTLLETEYPTAFEPPDEADSDGGLSPAEELELASELLEVSGDEELEEFLGELISRATHAVTNFARSKTGRALGHMLGSAFKKIEPIANQALDAYIQGRASRAGGGGDGGGGGGAPSAASALSDVAEDVTDSAELQPGPDIGQLLGLELEGLSPEDRDFEVCRQLVRLASSAAQQASLAPPQANPDAVAQQAITAAASEYAPGLLEQVNGSPGGASPRSGRWVRRGRTITLYGIYGPAAKGAANGGQAS
jgi:hypothetical protein